MIPKKAKDDKSYDAKYFKAGRKRMVDILPETLPKRMIRDDIEVTDKCVERCFLWEPRFSLMCIIQL
jgi:hypothetical protein